MSGSWNYLNAEYYSLIEAENRGFLPRKKPGMA